MINTGKVTDRRDLRFNSVDEMLADVERVAAADRAGTLRATGNWSAGTTFNHIAAFINYLYEGYPPSLRPPWFVKLIARPMKKKYCFGKMPSGVRIPKVEGGTLATETVACDDGLRALRAAGARLKAGPPKVPSPLFGPLTHDEAIGINLRHAELHLSFLHPA